MRTFITPSRIYFHGGETPRYNSIMGYDPRNHVDARDLGQSDRIARRKADRQHPHVEGLDQIYVVSPLSPGQ